MKSTFLLLSLLSISAVSNCLAQNRISEDYYTSIKDWHKERDAALKSANGWLSLAGLYWLEEGQNNIGAADGNDIQFPDGAPDHWGSILLQDEQASFVSKILNTSSENETKSKKLTYLGSQPTVVEYQSLQWHLLKRGNKIGLRLRDTLHPHRYSFDSVPYFDIDPSWNIRTAFIPANKSDSMRISNVLGMEFSRHPIGYIEISHLDKTHRLSLIDAGSKYFLIFADGTTGESTYGGGRYLYIDKPDAGQELQVDFNKAENPPCVFTEFATCLLPPAENKMSFRIEAGELYEGH